MNSELFDNLKDVFGLAVQELKTLLKILRSD